MPPQRVYSERYFFEFLFQIFQKHLSSPQRYLVCGDYTIRTGTVKENRKTDVILQLRGQQPFRSAAHAQIVQWLHKDIRPVPAARMLRTCLLWDT